MKPENTPENKAKFFANYWGQSIACMNYPCGLLEIGQETIWRTDHLSLRSIESLTDEEESHFNAMLDEVFHCHDGISQDFISMTYEMIDYLRSIGVLVPWNGLTPHDIAKAFKAKLEINMLSEWIDQGNGTYKRVKK